VCTGALLSSDRRREFSSAFNCAREVVLPLSLPPSTVANRANTGVSTSVPYTERRHEERKDCIQT